jgi:hypothetical protein
MTVPLVAFEDLASGFQYPREAAIAAARERRDDAEFERLCSRLYKQKFAADRRAADPERARMERRAWIERHRDYVRQLERERSRRRRRGQKPEPIENVCVGCGGTWSSPRVARFCSRRCQRRFHYEPAPRAAKPVAAPIINFLRAHPGARARDIWIACGLRPNTVMRWLGRATSRGAITCDDSVGRRRYWIGRDGTKQGVGEFTLRAAGGPEIRA